MLIDPGSLCARRGFQFGLFSLLIKERLYIGEAVIATVVGIAFGERALWAVRLLSSKADIPTRLDLGGYSRNSVPSISLTTGPHGANLFSPQAWGAHATNEITLEVTRVVIAIGVFAVGVELPKVSFSKLVRGFPHQHDEKRHTSGK
jgi:NhaP-type Na+/H+ or K+/H+ antiporter